MDQDKELEVTPLEFKEWLESRLTQHIVTQILAHRDAIVHYLATGGTITKDSEYSTDFMVGQIRGLNEIFNLFSEAKEESKERAEYGH
jgi:hypothetical protein